MNLDTTQAWRDASATVGANKEVLAAIAGVFFLLPSLAFSLFMPQPEPPAGAEPKQLFALLSTFYQAAAPYIVINALIQIVGQLAVLVLIARAGRVTVSEAIREALSGVLPYVGSQLLVMLATMVAAGIVAALAAATGSVALAVVIGIAVLGLAIYVAVRLSLVPAVIAIERLRNPVAVLQRSWDLTRGNAGRIMLFVFLLVLALAVIGTVVGVVLGVALALIAGAEGARIGGAVISATIGAGFTLYIVAAFAAMHRQLAGSGGAGLDDTFE